MAYGHRLNIEDIFFQDAERHYQIASTLTGMVHDVEPQTGDDSPFKGYPTDEGLAEVSIALVGWAVCLESFTNLAWNQSIATTLPKGKIRKAVERHLSISDRLSEVLRHFGMELGPLVWWKSVLSLFELRNALVHYREAIVYQGFEFAPPIARKLSEDTVKSARDAAIAAIRELGKHCKLRTGFLDGKYEIATINA